MTWSSDRAAPPVGPPLALLTALVQSVGTAIVAPGEPSDVGFIGYGLLILSGLALSDRHKFPRLNGTIVAVAILVYHVLDRPPGVSFLAPMIAASVAISRGYRWLAWGVAAAAYGLWVVADRPTLDWALIVAAITAGLGVLTEVGTVVSREARRAAREQRRLHEERQRRQASEERLRIAAELHDVLGHHLSLINVRAGVGLHLMNREPEQARIALDTIQQTSAEALREVQAVLNTLYPTGQSAPLAPAPKLERLDELTADAGVAVHTTTSGEPRALPASVDRAAYRIVQEALTNVRRHAGPGASVTITIEYQPAALVIAIADTGGIGPVAEAVPGNGITGMRERAAALGGTLTAGAAPDGGWLVRAHLPTDAETPADRGPTEKHTSEEIMPTEPKAAS